MASSGWQIYWHSSDVIHCLFINNIWSSTYSVVYMSRKNIEHVLNQVFPDISCSDNILWYCRAVERNSYQVTLWFQQQSIVLKEVPHHWVRKKYSLQILTAWIKYLENDCDTLGNKGVEFIWDNPAQDVSWIHWVHEERDSVCRDISHGIEILQILDMLEKLDKSYVGMMSSKIALLLSWWEVVSI